MHPAYFWSHTFNFDGVIASCKSVHLLQELNNSMTNDLRTVWSHVCCFLYWDGGHSERQSNSMGNSMIHTTTTTSSCNYHPISNKKRNNIEKNTYQGIFCNLILRENKNACQLNFRCFKSIIML